MREAKIRKLIKILEESNIEELEISTWRGKIRITKKLSNHANSNSDSANSETLIKLNPVSEKAKPQSKTDSETESVEHLIPIKSPMVGTFYRAPAPGAKAYVELNQEIGKGQVVCIVEAMKLMNEIESEIDGKIVEALVEDSQPVEYGKALFKIEPV